MVKRLLTSLAILAACLFGGGALVGFDVIPAGAGVAVWVAGIALATVSFVPTKPKV